MTKIDSSLPVVVFSLFQNDALLCYEQIGTQNKHFPGSFAAGLACTEVLATIILTEEMLAPSRI